MAVAEGFVCVALFQGKVYTNTQYFKECNDAFSGVRDESHDTCVFVMRAVMILMSEA